MPTKPNAEPPPVTGSPDAPADKPAAKGRRVVHVTTTNGERVTYPITALNEYDAMLADPSHGSDQRVYETNVYWQAAGAPGESVRDWLGTVEDIEFEVEMPTPTAETSPA